MWRVRLRDAQSADASGAFHTWIDIQASCMTRDRSPAPGAACGLWRIRRIRSGSFSIKAPGEWSPLSFFLRAP